MKFKNKFVTLAKWKTRLVHFFGGREESKWTPISEGEITIHGWVYKLEPAEIEGTYVREVDQYGTDRWWITKPGGTPYLEDASCIQVKHKPEDQWAISP